MSQITYSFLREMNEEGLEISMNRLSSKCTAKQRRGIDVELHLRLLRAYFRQRLVFLDHQSSQDLQETKC
jgi:hypothetical protein